MTIGVPDFIDPRQPQGLTDELYTGFIPNGNTVGSITCNAGVGLYEALLVRVISTTAKLVTFQVIDLVNQIQPILSYSRYLAPNLYNRFFFPTTGPINTVYTVDYTLSVAAGNNTDEIDVIGIRDWAPGLRFDGLLPPQNSQSAQVTLSTLGVTVLPAPGITARYLIGELIPPQGNKAGAVTTAYLQGTQNGQTIYIAVGCAASDQLTWQIPSYGGAGILLDPNTAVIGFESVALTNIQSGTIFYDVVY